MFADQNGLGSNCKPIMLIKWVNYNNTDRVYPNNNINPNMLIYLNQNKVNTNTNLFNQFSFKKY